MRAWEKSSHHFSDDEANVVIDALRLKAAGGLFTADTRWNRRPNRYDRVADRIENGLAEEAVELGPAQRWLARRAVRWTQEFPLPVLDAMKRDGYADDICFGAHREVTLRAGSRPANLVFLAPLVLENLGDFRPGTPPALGPVAFEIFAADEQRVAA